MIDHKSTTLGHETADADIGPLIKFAIFLALTTLVCAAICVGLYRYLDQREARYETDFEIRLDKLEAREQAVAELEEKLGAKEDQLATYVAQAQGALQRRESQWWNKQIGGDDDLDAEVA